MSVKIIQVFFEDIVRLIFYPQKHWKLIRTGDVILSGLSKQLIVPGLIAVFVSTIIGDWVFKSEFGFYFFESIINAIRITAMLLLFFLATHVLVPKISKFFSIPVNDDGVREIVFWAMVPMVLAAIITGFFPFFKLIWVGAFYGLYLVSTGLIDLFYLDKRHITNFLMVLLSGIFISWIFIAMVLNLITTLIFEI